VTIDAQGNVWYTGNKNGTVGKLDYAIAVVDSIVWDNESGKRPDALVRFDSTTETFQSRAIPSGGIYAGIIRHMRPTREGNLLIHQSSTNRMILVMLKPATAMK
jgi:virginiamycin B lyase